MPRWLRKPIQLAGIACHFTGHSTRSASTSAAARAGLPLDTMLVAAGWSLSETFKHFYLRSPGKGELARAVLTVVPEYVTGIMEHGLLYLKVSMKRNFFQHNLKI